MIKAVNISKSYGDLKVLESVSFEAEGAWAVTGESGRGKTSLLYILSLLDSADSGEVWIKGVDILKLKEKDAARFRADNFGFVFQHHFLLSDLDAKENALLPLRVCGKLDKSSENYVEELFEYFGIQDRMKHFPDEMSGGEKQRAAVVRALAAKAEIIFADEPTGSLDKDNAEKLQELFLNMTKERGTTLILSTHNIDFAEKCGVTKSVDELERNNGL